MHNAAFFRVGQIRFGAIFFLMHPFGLIPRPG